MRSQIFFQWRVVLPNLSRQKKTIASRATWATVGAAELRGLPIEKDGAQGEDQEVVGKPDWALSEQQRCRK